MSIPASGFVHREAGHPHDSGDRSIEEARTAIRKKIGKRPGVVACSAQTAPDRRGTLASKRVTCDVTPRDTFSIALLLLASEETAFDDEGYKPHANDGGDSKAKMPSHMGMRSTLLALLFSLSVAFLAWPVAAHSSPRGFLRFSERSTTQADDAAVAEANEPPRHSTGLTNAVQWDNYTLWIEGQRVFLQCVRRLLNDSMPDISVARANFIRSVYPYLTSGWTSSRRWSPQA
jgi:hypothetical protein